MQEKLANEILDAAKQPATTEDFWVTLEGDPSYGYNVTANFYALPEVPEAYVVFKDAEGAVLGVFYVVVLAVYLLFEKVVINYRPVLIEGVLEASYPSSTTVLWHTGSFRSRKF